MLLMTDQEESVDLPADLLERVDTRLEQSSFEDRSEYITYVLDKILSELEDNSESSDSKNVDDSSSKTDDEIKDRLRDLGYL